MSDINVNTIEQSVVVDVPSRAAHVVSTISPIEVITNRTAAKLTPPTPQPVNVNPSGADIVVVHQTQQIVVDPDKNTFSVVNAGPIGSRGPVGPAWPSTILDDGELLTKELGSLIAITRSGLAADPAFTAGLAAHVAAADPHPGYVTTAEGITLISAHEAAADPHPVYLRASEAVTSLAGTAGEIDVSASTGSVVLSLPASIAANAATATKLATPRNFSMIGHVTVPDTLFDGSLDLELNALISSGVLTNAMFSTVTGEPGSANMSTYTPVLQSGGVNVTLGTGGTAAGAYIRHGKLIYALGDVRMSTTAGAAMTAGQIQFPLPTIPSMFTSSSYLLGGVRITGMAGNTVAHFPGIIGSVGTTYCQIRYNAAYPSGADTIHSTTAPAAAVLNAANAYRISWAVLYLSTT
jgi:hypothetical protein